MVYTTPKKGGDWGMVYDIVIFHIEILNMINHIEIY